MGKLLSANTSKAIGGGVGAFTGYLASEPVAENVSKILIWLISMLVDVPKEIEDAITWLIGAGVVLAIGYVGAWIAPPNSSTDEARPDSEATKQ